MDGVVIEFRFLSAAAAGSGCAIITTTAPTHSLDCDEFIGSLLLQLHWLEPPLARLLFALLPVMFAVML